MGKEIPSVSMIVIVFFMMLLISSARAYGPDTTYSDPALMNLLGPLVQEGLFIISIYVYGKGEVFHY